jgi:hypothetical protein
MLKKRILALSFAACLVCAIDLYFRYKETRDFVQSVASDIEKLPSVKG